ncbi:MAG: hypothetical protein ABFD16_31710, partial [Thermoguttaceae bacterium]
MTKERRLGRGLEALLGRVSGKDEAPRQAPSTIPFPSAARGESAYGGETGNPYESSSHLADEVQLPTDAPVAAEPAAAVGEPGPLRIDVKRIDSNPFQPRQEFDQAELQSLCESL